MTILGDIFNGVKFGIEFFVDKVPKPIKVILFLVMLLFLFSVIPMMLHLMGIHCNTKEQVMTTGVGSVLDNIAIWRADKELINSSQFVPENVGFIGVNTFSCRTGYCNVSGELFYASDDPCDNKTTEWAYGSQRAAFSRCTTCSGVVDNLYISSPFGGDQGYKCFGDAARVEDPNLWQRTFCRTESNCIPPTNYIFNHTIGMYQCTDLTICGENATDPEFELDAKLDEANAELLYTTEGDDIDRAILLTCDEESLEPQITLFSIPIFDYRLWVFLYILGGMFVFLKNIKNH